jgi:hypothetical protein
MQQPAATLEDLAEWCEQRNTPITPQGLDDWFCPEGVQCLQQLTQLAVGNLLQSEAAAIPLLQRFVGVYVEDCTQIGLPVSLAEVYPGCGGNDVKGRDQAALKSFVRMELQAGEVVELSFLPGRQADVTAGQKATRLPAGALRLKDLGFFDAAMMAEDTQAGVKWISRLGSGMRVRAEGTWQPLASWLRRQRENQIDVSVQVAQQEALPCRLMAVRCSSEVRQRRLRKLHERAKDKGRSVSERQKVLCGWLVLITNMTADELSIEEAWVLYRARWQIELLFKLWKSHGRLDKSSGRRGDRVLCEVFAKLLAMLVQHWVLLTAGPWLDGKSAPSKVRRLRHWVAALADALGCREELEMVLTRIQSRLHRLKARYGRKRQPSTLELLKDPSRVGLVLT